MEIMRTLSKDAADKLAKLNDTFELPRVVVDNDASSNATVIKVNSAKHHGILLKFVEVITDLNILVKKAYIASDGDWFMDVFNVTDQCGGKITDEDVISRITKALESESSLPVSNKSVGLNPPSEQTRIELLGSNRTGLFSDVCAVLTDLHCNIVSGEAWSHKTRAAFVIHITDADSGAAISDPTRLSNLKRRLGNLLKYSDESRDAKTEVCQGSYHPARRLHQMILNDHDYDISNHDEASEDETGMPPRVDIDKWSDNDYSVVVIRSADRPKLLYDTIYTLIDMGYVIFHGNVDAEGPEAYQEYYIRRRDGQPMKTDEERERLMQCLKAAIKRRPSNGLKLELCTTDRVGLLADVTRVLRENGLTLTRAEVITDGERVADTFYVQNALGCLVDARTIDSIRESIGKPELQVKGSPQDETAEPVTQESPTKFLFSLLNSYFN